MLLCSAKASISDWMWRSISNQMSIYRSRFERPSNSRWNRREISMINEPIGYVRCGYWCTIIQLCRRSPDQWSPILSPFLQNHKQKYILEATEKMDHFSNSKMVHLFSCLSRTSIRSAVAKICQLSVIWNVQNVPGRWDAVLADAVQWQLEWLRKYSTRVALYSDMVVVHINMNSVRCNGNWILCSRKWGRWERNKTPLLDWIHKEEVIILNWKWPSIQSCCPPATSGKYSMVVALAILRSLELICLIRNDSMCN